MKEEKVFCSPVRIRERTKKKCTREREIGIREGEVPWHTAVPVRIRERTKKKCTREREIGIREGEVEAGKGIDEGRESIGYKG